MLWKAVLWTQWVHPGRLVAGSPVELAVLDAATFRTIAGRVSVLNPCKHYASEHRERLPLDCGGQVDLLSDHSGTFDDQQEPAQSALDTHEHSMSFDSNESSQRRESAHSSWRPFMLELPFVDLTFGQQTQGDIDGSDAAHLHCVWVDWPQDVPMSTTSCWCTAILVRGSTGHVHRLAAIVRSICILLSLEAR